MGEVYRARDRLSGSSVAVKVLRVRAAGDGDQIERFLREARVLSDLHHPAIVAYVAHGETASGEVYLAMEWLDGEDLAAHIERSRLTVNETVTLARRVSEAMGAAHSRGIVHRDLKPENIFLQFGRVERAKVLDFGLARLADGFRQLTRTGLTVGTPIYMAPEQALADTNIDARADIFSLGCVLFQCLTGRVPFHGERIRAVLMKILHEEPPSVLELCPDVPPPLADLVSRMLSKDPASRPRDGSALAKELEQFDFSSASLPPSSTAPTSITRAEQRLTCFVVVGSAPPPEEDVALAKTLTLDLSVSKVRKAVENHGATLDVIADGTLVVALDTTGSATDLAAQAARCAFSIRQHIADAPIAITMGRRNAGQTSSVSQAVERAVVLLGDLSGTHKPAEAASSRAEPIRIDEMTAGLLDARFEVERDDRSFVLLSLRDLAGKPRTVLGKVTPFVGRDRELSTLRAAFDECVNESVASAVLVTAPAGYGKSRLCFEFLRLLTELGTKVGIWRGRGNLMSAGAPLAILSSAIRSTSLISGAEPIEERRRKIQARVTQHTPAEDATRFTEFLGELAGTPFPDDSSPALRAARNEPQLMAEQMRRVWEDFLSAECASESIVLVLEDLQWGDLPSIKFVDGALRRLRNRPLFVLATARPTITDTFPRLWADRGVTELRLGPLTPRACERIVRAVCGDELKADEIADLVARAEGNPFFVEEFIRARMSGDHECIPDTLVAMVQTRIERLDPEARRVLRAASIFGTSFTWDAINALLGGRAASDDLVRWLGQLTDEELIDEPEEDAARIGYTFRQTLVREAAYAMLTEDDRKLGHCLAAQWLQSREANPAVIAQHYERAARPLEASAAYLKAAERAQAASDLGRAVEYCQRGAALGGSLADSGAFKTVEATAHLARGELAAAVTTANEALSQLSRGAVKWCNAAVTLLSGDFLLGDWGGFESAVEDLLALEPEADARNAYDAAVATASSLSSRGGRHDYSKRCLERLSARVIKDKLPDTFTAGRIASALATDAWFGRADPWDQLQEARRAVGAFTKCRDGVNVGYSEITIGAALIAMGAHAEAEALLSRTLSTVERAEFHLCVAAVRPWLALSLAYLGEGERAVEESKRAIRASQAAGNAYIEGTARSALALIELMNGNAEAAEHEAATIVDETRSRSLTHGEALASLAAARLRLGDTEGALSAASAAMRWLGARGGLGHVESFARLGYVDALVAAGREDIARLELMVARDRLDVRSRNIADASYRAGFFECVPENARTVALARQWDL